MSKELSLLEDEASLAASLMASSEAMLRGLIMFRREAQKDGPARSLLPYREQEAGRRW